MRLEDYPKEPRFSATVLKSEPINEESADVEVRSYRENAYDRS